MAFSAFVAFTASLAFVALFICLNIFPCFYCIAFDKYYKTLCSKTIEQFKSKISHEIMARRSRA